MEIISTTGKMQLFTWAGAVRTGARRKPAGYDPYRRAAALICRHHGAVRMTNDTRTTARYAHRSGYLPQFVVPKLQALGWDDEPHSIAEQRTITDGPIIPAGKGFVHKPPKRVDFLSENE